MLKRIQALGLVLGVVFLGASCGDDGGAAVTDTTAETDTTETDTTPETDTVATADTTTVDDTSVADTVEAPRLPIGLVYAESTGVGFASYHFDAEDDIYVDYTHADAAGWGLDSGAPLPTRKPFTDTSLDYENRRFTGTLDWTSDPFGGRDKFVYDMRFSDDFLEISGGTVVLVFTDGSEHTFEFGQDVQYRAITDTDPYPFASLVSCLTRPLPLEDVVFVGVFEDAQCTKPTGTTIALPVDDGDGCCNGHNDTNASFSGFSCSGGDYSFTMAYNLCDAAEGFSGTAQTSAAGCQPFQLLGNLYLRVMPGGACAD